MCVPNVKCFTALLRAPLRAHSLMTTHQDPSDLPVKIKYVPILQLDAKSDLTVMAVGNELKIFFKERIPPLVQGGAA